MIRKTTNESAIERNNRIRRTIVACMMALSLALLVVCTTGWVKEGLVAAQAAERYESAREEIVNSKSHDINFSAIHPVGNDVVSWIYIPGTVIDYPLVKGSDNDYYIDHDAYGNESKAGAIFMNWTNNADLNDPKTVIFGHNMRDGSMFSGLHNYESEEYGREHSDCYIYLDDGTVNHYKLRFYIFTDPNEDAVYIVSPTEETIEGASAALASVADICFDECHGGNLICLSTCTYHTLRTVVVFEFVDHQKPIQGVSEGMSEQGILPDSIKDADKTGQNGKVGSLLPEGTDDSGSRKDTVSDDSVSSNGGGLRGTGGFAGFLVPGASDSVSAGDLIAGTAVLQ